MVFISNKNSKKIVALEIIFYTFFKSKEGFLKVFINILEKSLIKILPIISYGGKNLNNNINTIVPC